MCLSVGLFGFILFGTLWTIWNWMFVSFPRLGKFSPISSNKFSASFSLLRSLECRCSSAWCFPISSLSDLHFFLFCCSDWIPLSFLLIFSSSSLLLNRSYVYFSSVILQLCDCYLVLSYCSVSLLKFCVHPFFSFVGLIEFSEHLYDHYFELSIRSLTSSLRTFPVLLPCCFIWNTFLCFFIFLDTLCWFLHFRQNSHLFQSWRSGFV